MTAKNRYILYARKSSEAEDKQVASVQSQIDELKRLADVEQLDIIGVITDEKSAKAPDKRTGFELLKSRVEAGEANGIICWKLDRLARNPVDGGWVNWNLQQGTIQHIRTYDRDYRVGDNVLLMMVEFGMANQFVIDLSANTKRGMRSKVAKGWFPHYAPVGYMNRHIRKGECDIVPDPERFDKVRRLWHELVYHHRSIRELYRIANNELHLKLRTGKGMTFSKFLVMFSNPFYYGRFRFKGEMYDGKHEPMISKHEWDMAQEIVHSRSRSRKKRYTFAYTGMIRCGLCGSMVTAEEKYKNIVTGGRHTYRYYRCTRSQDPKCPSRPVNEKLIEDQIMEHLSQVTINPVVQDIVLRVLRDEVQQDGEQTRNIYRTHQKDLNRVLDNMTSLVKKNVSGLISDDEYLKLKKEYQEEKVRLEGLLKSTSSLVVDWMARAEKVLDFAVRAKEIFATCDLETKKQIMLFLGSNFILRGNLLEFQVNKALTNLKGLEKGLASQGRPIEPTKENGPHKLTKAQSSNISKWGG